MWPSTPSYSSFKDVACPRGANCKQPNCLFRHEKQAANSAEVETQSSSQDGVEVPSANQLPPKPVVNPNVRNDSRQKRGPSSTDPTVTSPVKATVNTGEPRPGDTSLESKPRLSGQERLKILERKPPAPRKALVSRKPETSQEVEVSLRPDSMHIPGVSFPWRCSILSRMREHVEKLNEQLRKSLNPAMRVLALDPKQINRFVVKEERHAAEQGGALYHNTITKRIATLSKMTVEGWAKERKAVLEKERAAGAHNTDSSQVVPAAPLRIDTGLSHAEEVLYLSMFLVCPQDDLWKYDYVTWTPTYAAIEAAVTSRRDSAFWETCDRCRQHFQCFQYRSMDDGSLTTGGVCRHHWGRLVSLKDQPLAEAKYSCCQGVKGSAPCTIGKTHVFKCSNASRLAAVMEFVHTPDNVKVEHNLAVCIDCEMGYTTEGFELLRLTALSWPDYNPLIDVLVRPFGYMLDFNTQFSGITAEKFLNADTFDPQNPTFDFDNLQIVDSPEKARSVLLEHISRSTPLIGHGIENDLKALSLVHPRIVDTVLLYPHEYGLPKRRRLKTLAQDHLNIVIQRDGPGGHNSYEDAMATGELVRLKLKNDWEVKKHAGWTKDDGVFKPPLPMSFHRATKRKVQHIEEIEKETRGSSYKKPREYRPYSDFDSPIEESESPPELNY